METWSTHHLFQQAQEALGPDCANDLRSYAQRLISKDVAVVFNLAHLARITGVDHKVLRGTVRRTREASNYRMYSIRKRSRGRRFIHSVSADLFKVQQFVNKEILQKCKPHVSSFAFHPSGGIKKCAEQHCGARWIFQFDLRDFFYTVNEVDCYRVFRRLGYSKLLSFELGRICTTTYLPRTNKQDLREQQRRYFASSEFRQRRDYPGQFLAYAPLSQSELLGVLAQGAPSSPMLSNLAALRLDASLYRFAMEHSLTYTRYADDLTFSATDLPVRIDRGHICSQVLQRIRKAGFKENRKKTRVAGPGSKKIVLGLLVDGEKPRISKETYRRIDRYLYASDKYGLTATAAHEGFDSAYGFHNHLAGLIAFVKDVDPLRWAYFNSHFAKIQTPWEL